MYATPCPVRNSSRRRPPSPANRRHAGSAARIGLGHAHPGSRGINRPPLGRQPALVPREICPRYHPMHREDHPQPKARPETSRGRTTAGVPGDGPVKPDHDVWRWPNSRCHEASAFDPRYPQPSLSGGLPSLGRTQGRADKRPPCPFVVLRVLRVESFSLPPAPSRAGRGEFVLGTSPCTVRIVGRALIPCGGWSPAQGRG